MSVKKLSPIFKVHAYIIALNVSSSFKVEKGK